VTDSAFDEMKKKQNAYAERMARLKDKRDASKKLSDEAKFAKMSKQEQLAARMASVTEQDDDEDDEDEDGDEEEDLSGEEDDDYDDDDDYEDDDEDDDDDDLSGGADLVGTSHEDAAVTSQIIPSGVALDSLASGASAFDSGGSDGVPLHSSRSGASALDSGRSGAASLKSDATGADALDSDRSAKSAAIKGALKKGSAYGGSGDMDSRSFCDLLI